MVEVDTVTFGGASASGSFRGPYCPGGGCWRLLDMVGGPVVTTCERACEPASPWVCCRLES